MKHAVWLLALVMVVGCNIQPTKEDKPEDEATITFDDPLANDSEEENEEIEGEGGAESSMAAGGESASNDEAAGGGNSNSDSNSDSSEIELPDGGLDTDQIVRSAAAAAVHVDRMNKTMKFDKEARAFCEACINSDSFEEQSAMMGLISQGYKNGVIKKSEALDILNRAKAKAKKEFEKHMWEQMIKSIN